jgi:hypothetical protein
MSGPPQCPPAVGSLAPGHVRPPLRQPTPVQPGTMASGPSGLVGGLAGSALPFGSLGGAPSQFLLQPPARQMGLPAFLPPQEMPFAQYPNFQ